jgi:CHASE2 domain-containing sensor protein
MPQKLLILDLDGKFEKGFSAWLEVWQDGIPLARVQGRLSANPHLLAHYRQWQQRYSSLEAIFRALSDSHTGQITNSSERKNAIAACHDTAALVEQVLNQWLNHDPQFEPIRTQLLDTEKAFRLWIRTNQIWAQRLPWERWDVLQKKQAEVGLLISEYEVAQRQFKVRDRIRILAVLGAATDLKNLDKEQQILNEVAGRAGAEIVWETAPTPQRLNELLRQGKWDIFVFSGHSASTDEGIRCEIQLTQTARLEIPDFRFALREATAQGLRLAIFNSCDGIGLAHQLAAERGMALPHLVFMREKLPDAVAPKFLYHFLDVFTKNQSLYASIHTAQQILHDDWEQDYPSASWLPVVCTNPAEEAPTWHSLSTAITKRQQRRSLLKVLGVGLAIATLTMGVRELGTLEWLELKGYDLLMQQKPQEKTDDRFLIVTIDQQDMAYQDDQGMKRAQIPGSTRKRSLSGKALAILLQKLQPHKPAVIGLDILRPIAAQEDYSPLAQQLTKPKASNVIGICSDSEQIGPLPELPRSQVGFSEFPIDNSPDNSPGLVRRYTYQARFGEKVACLPSSSKQDYVPSFGVLIAKSYLASQNKDFNDDQLKRGILELNVVKANVGDLLQQNQGPYKSLENKTEAKSGRQFMLNFRRIADTGTDAIVKIAPPKTLQQVLAPDFNSASVQNKIVLIGVTEPRLDDFVTPFSKAKTETVSGVYVHAHAVSQLLDNLEDLENRRPQIILFWALWQEGFWVVVWAIAAGLVTWQVQRLKWLMLSNGLLLVVLGIGGILLFNLAGFWVPLVPTAIAIVLSAGVIRLGGWRGVIKAPKGLNMHKPRANQR